jgi:hypothetical protein
MIADRTTWIVKQRRMQEALELVTAEIERARTEDVQFRVYTPNISPDVLVFEIAGESVAALDKFWAGYDRDSPEATAFWDKWFEVSKRSVGTDRWNLSEWR